MDKTDKVFDMLSRILMMLPPERFGYHVTHWTVPLLWNRLEKNIGERNSLDTVRLASSWLCMEAVTLRIDATPGAKSTATGNVVTILDELEKDVEFLSLGAIQGHQDSFLLFSGRRGETSSVLTPELPKA